MLEHLLRRSCTGSPASISSSASLKTPWNITVLSEKKSYYRKEFTSRIVWASWRWEIALPRQAGLQLVAEVIACVKRCSGNGRGWLGAVEKLACVMEDNLLVKRSLPSPSPAGWLMKRYLGISSENLGSAACGHTEERKHACFSIEAS